MYPLGSILVSLAKVLSMITTLYQYIIIGAVIVTWVGANPANPIVRFLYMVTEPVFSRVRRLLPRFMFRLGVDFTPLIVLILLVFLENLVVGNLYHFGSRMTR
jgi:YggT family protein